MLWLTLDTTSSSFHLPMHCQAQWGLGSRAMPAPTPWLTNESGDRIARYGIFLFHLQHVHFRSWHTDRGSLSLFLINWMLDKAVLSTARASLSVFS